jgi:phosphoribosyl 1,2-cyclic phosphodiesterase
MEGGSHAAFCVLASGSRGNCTVLRAGGRLILLDAGLSPKRTAALLHGVGLSLARVTDIVLTHLDHDHCHLGWCAGAKGGGAPHALVHVHRSHRGRAERMGLLHRRSRVFEDAVRLDESRDGSHERVRISAAIASHDSLGVAAFRVRIDGAADLGYATDMGHVPGSIVEHLRGVDALAFESNYCPELQLASDRPEFLKQRIMGGGGHLSNQECADAVRRIGPRPGAPVVLLHLSQECNTPERAMAGLRCSPWNIAVSCQNEPTGWVGVERIDAPEVEVVPRAEPVQHTLWA